MDNILGNGVGRRGLGPENGRNTGGGTVSRLDLLVFADQVQGVKLLALVFVEPLDLDVENGVGVDFNPLGFLQVNGQVLLAGILDGQKTVKDLDVFQKPAVVQRFQAVRIFLETVSDQIFNVSGQAGIAVEQPAAEGNSVGLIIKFLRVQLVKMAQFGFF